MKKQKKPRCNTLNSTKNLLRENPNFSKFLNSQTMYCIRRRYRKELIYTTRRILISISVYMPNKKSYILYFNVKKMTQISNNNNFIDTHTHIFLITTTFCNLVAQFLPKNYTCDTYLCVIKSQAHDCSFFFIKTLNHLTKLR